MSWMIIFPSMDNSVHFKKDMIDIRKLREIAPKLKEPIRSLLLSQPENMTAEEYVAKVTDWLKLLELVEKQ